MKIMNTQAVSKAAVSQVSHNNVSKQNNPAVAKAAVSATPAHAAKHLNVKG